MTEPKDGDMVLGGQSGPLPGDVVLGGLAGALLRLAALKASFEPLYRLRAEEAAAIAEAAIAAATQPYQEEFPEPSLHEVLFESEEEEEEDDQPNTQPGFWVNWHLLPVSISALRERGIAQVNLMRDPYIVGGYITFLDGNRVHVGLHPRRTETGYEDWIISQLID